MALRFKRIGNAIREFFRDEITGWKPLELIWLGIATAVILAVALYSRDSIISIIAGLTGVWCVILTGKGKRSSFIFGVVNVVFYAWIAFLVPYYGEVMLNMLYYLPMNFVGFIAWRKHINKTSGEVKKQRLPLKKGIIVYLVTAAAIGGYGFVLQLMGGKLPYIDSMSTVVSVVAQVLSVKRLTEQWVLWIAVDVVTVIMWLVNFINGGENLATLAMWSVYLINAIIMFIKWNREAGRIESESKQV